MGTAGAAAEPTGAVCRAGGALRSSLWAGRVGTSQLPLGSSRTTCAPCLVSELWILQLPLMSVLHLSQAQGVLQRLFKLSCSLPFVCLYFSLGCWAVISFLTPAALSAELWVTQCPALCCACRRQIQAATHSGVSLQWNGHKPLPENLLWAEVSISSLCEGVCSYSACSNLLVHHPQLPGFCVPVLWSAWRVKSMWSLISVCLCLCRVVLCCTECLNSSLI